MGCTTSKLDDLHAVSLCRQRCSFIDQALHLRFALAQAHFSYLLSLNSLGASLHSFFNQDLHSSSSSSSSSPVLHTHVQEHSPPQNPDRLSSHSHSGSHLHFISDSDEDEDHVSLHHHHHHHHSAASSPRPHSQHLQPIPYSCAPEEENLGYGFGAGNYIHMNYMKNQALPSVVYEHRPMNPEIVHMAESSYPPYSYGGGYTSSLEASTSKAPPPPPSPPGASAWEFLNPFESFDKYYPPYPSSLDSRELREEEGIPDLEEEGEEEGYVNEVVKEIDGDQKFVDVKSDGGGNGSKGVS